MTELATRKVSLLFGAGASVDAGLPQTRELAEKIVERANSETPYHEDRSWVYSLNYVYGSMVDYGSRKGGNPLESVDFERLISTLRLLKNKDNHEVTPFVSAWKPGAEGLAQSKPISTHDFSSHLTTSIVSGHSYEDLIDDIRRIAGGTEDNSRSFVKAEEKIFKIVKDTLNTLEDTSYLNPIATLAQEQPEGIDVLTLNYDLAVETMAGLQDKEICYGFENWAPGTNLIWNKKSRFINLIKMHGSLNWELDTTNTFSPQVQFKRLTNVTDGRPWIVLGDREKLSTQGPTLALLRAAEESLASTQHLVVAGYSFSDDHINNLIQNWMAGDEKRSLAIIDPGFPDEIVRIYAEESSFIENIIDFYGNRLYVFREGTANALERAIKAFPENPPSRWFSSRYTPFEDDAWKLEITLNGRNLINVNCDFLSSIKFFDSYENFKNGSQQLPMYQRHDKWETGQTKEFYYAKDVEEEIKLYVQGVTEADMLPIREGFMVEKG